MVLRDVNLIPGHILHRTAVTRHITLWCCGLLVFLCFLGIYYFHQVRVVLPKNRPATTLEDMHITLGATIEEINQTQQEIQQLSFQEAFLKQLTLVQPFSEVLFTLSENMNSGSWLTRLDVTSQKDKQALDLKMTLNGMSLTNDELGDLLNRLSESELYHQVVLKYARESEVTGLFDDPRKVLKVISFQIDCNIIKTAVM